MDRYCGRLPGRNNDMGQEGAPLWMHEYHADYGSGTLNSIYECQIVGDAPENISIDNGLPLERVLNLFLENLCIGYTVVRIFSR